MSADESLSLDLFLRESGLPFVVALLISFVQGALIGLEREKAKVDLPEEERHRVDYPGLRTFSLISVSGCLSGATLSGLLRLPDIVSWIIFACMTAFVVALSLLFAAYRFFKSGFVGMTTNVTMPIAYFVGLITGYGYILEALGLTFLVSLVLSMRRVAIKLAEKLTYEEYTSGLELGLIAFILGPVVYTLRPVLLGVPLWNAYLYFLVILSVSYLSYMAYKLLGRRSLNAVSILGGMVNSEAALVNVAKYSTSPLETGSFLLYVLFGFSIRGLIVASLGSFVFMGATGAFNLLKIFAPCYVALLATVIGLLRYRRTRIEVESENVPIVRSPLDFRTALKATLLYASMFALTRLVLLVDAPMLLVILSFIGGMASAMAIMFSLLSSFPVLDPESIALYVLLATAGSFISKVLYAAALLSRSHAAEVAKISVVLALLVLSYVAIAWTVF